jgi:hypothetical protein
MPAFLIAPAVAIVLAIVAGILRYRVRVKVTGRQNVGRGPLIAWGGDFGDEQFQVADPFDQFEFAATNRSLQGAVYLRAFGAVGQAQAGEEISIEATYSSQPIRLECNEDHRWETSFTGLAAKGIDLERGVRGWAVIAGRDKPFRSRKLFPRPAVNRLIPSPTPRIRPRG